MDKKICDFIFKKYDLNNVLLVFYCGSIGYNLNTPESDVDVTVILKEGKSYDKISNDNIDFFVYNYQYFLKVISLDHSADMYIKTSADVLQNIKRNIIYINDSFSAENQNIFDSINFYKYLSPFLSNFIEYYDNLLYIRCPQLPKRRMYHIFRVLGTLKQLSVTGRYDINDIEENSLIRLKQYKKECKENPVKARKDIEDALDELKKLVFIERYVDRNIYVGEVIGLKAGKTFY